MELESQNSEKLGSLIEIAKNIPYIGGTLSLTLSACSYILGNLEAMDDLPEIFHSMQDKLGRV